MASRRCPTGCAMGLPSGIKFEDRTKGTAKKVSTGADLAGAKPFMQDRTHSKPLHVKNPLYGKK